MRLQLNKRRSCRQRKLDSKTTELCRKLLELRRCRSLSEDIWRLHLVIKGFNGERQCREGKHRDVSKQCLRLFLSLALTYAVSDKSKDRQTSLPNPWGSIVAETPLRISRLFHRFVRAFDKHVIASCDSERGFCSRSVSNTKGNWFLYVHSTHKRTPNKTKLKEHPIKTGPKDLLRSIASLSCFISLKFLFLRFGKSKYREWLRILGLRGCFSSLPGPLRFDSGKPPRGKLTVLGGQTGSDWRIWSLLVFLYSS